MVAAGATTRCPNCDAPDPGKFCPACGQRQGDRVVSVRRLLLDALEDQFSISSALPRTVGALIARPGFLSNEYLRGRIARYIPPFRLYLATSIVFFLALSLLSMVRPDSLLTMDYGDSPPDSARAGSGRVLVPVDEDGAFFGIRVDPNSPADTMYVHVNFGIDALDRRIVQRLGELSHQSPEAIGRLALRGMVDRAPAGMFVLLPVFAALLKLMYIRSKRYYVEHFVFALHTHAFAFIMFTLMMPFSGTPIEVVLFFWIVIYYFLAMKRVYGQGVVVTLAKYFVVTTLYTILLSLVLLGVVAVALLLD